MNTESNYKPEEIEYQDTKFVFEISKFYTPANEEDKIGYCLFKVYTPYREHVTVVPVSATYETALNKREILLAEAKFQYAVDCGIYDKGGLIYD